MYSLYQKKYKLLTNYHRVHILFTNHSCGGLQENPVKNWIKAAKFHTFVTPLT